MKKLMLFYILSFGCFVPCPIYGQFTTVLNVPPDVAPASIGSYTQLNLFNGGSINSLRAGDTDNSSISVDVNISGGDVTYLRAYGGSRVTISGGIAGGALVDYIFAYAGSVLELNGGVGSLDVFRDGRVTISGGFVNAITTFSKGLLNISDGIFTSTAYFRKDSIVNISGGSIGGFCRSFGAVVNMSGGSVGKNFAAEENSQINISGGTFDEGFKALSGSQVNLRGTLFLLNGIDITDSLIETVPLTIADRGVTLSGLLADGSEFSFYLDGSDGPNSDYFHPDALLTVALVSPGDFNGDLAVDGSDFLQWQRGNSPNPLSQTDLANWQLHYGAITPLAAAIVPEPVAWTIAVATIICIAMSDGRSPLRRFARKLKTDRGTGG